jgi:hypothetical protein
MVLRRPIHSANERTKLSRILTSSRGVAMLWPRAPFESIQLPDLVVAGSRPEPTIAQSSDRPIRENFAAETSDRP